MVFNMHIFLFNYFQNFQICFQLLNSSESVNAAHLFLFIFWSFMQLYILSHMGDILTTHLQDVGEEIYQMNWYLLPIHIQKTLPFSLMVAEEAVLIKAFGSFACTRETFSKVFFHSVFFWFFLINSLITIIKKKSEIDSWFI